MSLTITVKLDDGDVARFLDLYNKGAENELTEDMLNQNVELHQAISEDMLDFWLENLAFSPIHPTADMLYSEFVTPENSSESGEEDEDDYDPCAHLGEEMEY